MESNLEIKGQWFLPNQTDQRLYGILTYDLTDGLYLELFGNFSEDSIFPELRDDNIILGISSDSKKITLYNCFVTKGGGITFVTGEESGTPSTEYRVNYALVGTHASSEDELHFNQISSQIFNLDEWVGISGFENNKPDLKKLQNHEITIDYKLPKPIEFKVNEEVSGNFNFSINHPGRSIFDNKVSLHQKTSFVLNCEAGKHFKELLKLTFVFQDLLVLALYKSTYPVRIVLRGDKHTKEFGDGKSYRKEVELLISLTIRERHNKKKFWPQMVFDYHRIKEDFEDIIVKWFSMHDKLKPAFNLVLEQFYLGSRFNENTFLNLAQAAETFHARIHNHTKMPKKDFGEMKIEILNLVPKKYHDWLNDQFNFGNNLNLHARLTELTEKYSNKIIDRILDDKEDFVKNVKHSRNYYTHYSESGKKNALKGSDLYFLSERLKALMVCAFLVEAGFTNEQLGELLDNIKWTNFNHLANWKN